MGGLVRLMYWLGWASIAIGIIERFAQNTGFDARLIEANIYPRNWLQLSFLAFVISLASAMYHRINEKA